MKLKVALARFYLGKWKATQKIIWSEQHLSQPNYRGAKVLCLHIQNQKIIFSDEAHFDLGGYVNKQNCRFWDTENPHAYIAKPSTQNALFGADFGPKA